MLHTRTTLFSPHSPRQARCHELVYGWLLVASAVAHAACSAGTGRGPDVAPTPEPPPDSQPECAHEPTICDATVDAPGGDRPGAEAVEQALTPLLEGRVCGAPLNCGGVPHDEWEVLGTAPDGVRVGSIAPQSVHGLWIVVWFPDCDHRDGTDVLLTALAWSAGGTLRPVGTLELLGVSAGEQPDDVTLLEARDLDGDDRGEAHVEYDTSVYSGEACEFSPAARHGWAAIVEVLPTLEVRWETQLAESYYEEGSPRSGEVTLSDVNGDGHADLIIETEIGESWECTAGHFETDEEYEAACAEVPPSMDLLLYSAESDTWEPCSSDCDQLLEERRAAAAQCPRWVAADLGQRAFLSAVWGAGPSAVVAVGVGGTIAHFDGSSWSLLSSSPTDRSLTAVWGSSATDIHAVGSDGTIVHFDGSRWTTQQSGVTAHLASIWGRGPRDIFAAGTSGTILHFDGSRWTPQQSGTTEHLRKIRGVGPSDVFAVGDNGAIVHFDGRGWRQVAAGAASGPLMDLWGSGPDNVFVVGSRGTVLRFDGTNWSAQASGTNASLSSVWGSGPSDVYAAGLSALIQYDGSAWRAADVRVQQPLHAVTGTGPRDVFAVGYGGTILSWDGSTWCTDYAGTERELEAVWAATSGHVFAVGPWGAAVSRSPRPPRTTAP